MSRTSPITGQQDLVSYDIMANGQSIRDVYILQAIEVSHRLNGISKARLRLYDGDPSKQEFENKEHNDFVPGSEIVINLGYNRDNEEVFRGFVISTGVKVRFGQHSQMEIDCVGHAYRMTQGRKNAYYLNKKDSEIIQSIVGNYGGKPAAGSIDSTSNQYEEVIQYYSSDWDFLMARAEINGMVVNTYDDKVSVKTPAFSGSPVLDLTFGMDIISTNLKLDGSYQFKTVKCSSWDQSQQSIQTGTSSEPSMNDQGSSDTSGQTLADHFFDDPVELHSSTPMDSNMLKAWADAQLLKSRLSLISGTITCQGSWEVKPDTLVKLDGLGTYFNGDAYVSGVKHTVEEGNWITELTFGMSPKWFVEEAPSVMAPPAAGRLPGIEGLFIGKVKQIHQDPLGETRIQVDIPVIQESGDGVWARLTSSYASNNFGQFFIPEVGDEVILGFLQNDPSFPIILGSVYSSSNPPPYTPDQQNSTKAIVTKNDLRLIFEDQDKNIIIQTPAGNKVEISDQNSSIKISDQNQNIITMDSNGIKLETNSDLTLKAMGKITLDATQKVEIKSTAQDVAISGLNVKAEASVKASISGNMAELKGNAMTEVKGGIVRIN